MKIYILFALALFMSFSSSYAEEGGLMKNVKSFRNWVSPPKDYYVPLVKEDLNISTRGMINKISFKNKYEGNHSLGIFLEHFTDDLYYVPLSKRYKTKLKVEISFYNQGTLLLTKHLEDIYEPFIGDFGSGFALFTYKVPQDLPLNTDLILQISILESDKHLFDTYGPTKLYIRKISDK